MTIAKRPSVGRDGAAYGFDLGETRRNIFLQMGLDRKLSDLPVGQNQLIFVTSEHADQSSVVIPGRAQSASPESITTNGKCGFRTAPNGG